MTLIIPDIHADMKRLELALYHAGEGPIAFLGDFIDQGPWSKGEAADGAVLAKVRALIEEGRAVAVMGNHELNAILYHRFDAAGMPLRKHSEKNAAQHQSFIDAFGIATPEALEWTDWFLNALPLWHEGAGFRLVHACWADTDIALVKARRPDGLLKPEDLAEIADESTPFGQAVKRIIAGPEATLPDGYFMTDAKGHKRREVRLRWWGQAQTWREAALSVSDLSSLPDTHLPPERASAADFTHAPAVFIGHYKMVGNPKFENTKVICLDYPYSACAYRFGGEENLRRENIIDATRAASAKATPPMGPDSAPIAGRTARIIFDVPKSQESIVSKALSIAPEKASDAARSTFVWETVGGRYRGDDETIVYQLSQALGDDVRFSVHWNASTY